MVSALDSGASASSPGRGHCVVFLGKTLHSHFTLDTVFVWFEVPFNFNIKVILK